MATNLPSMHRPYDATTPLLYAQVRPAETTEAVMAALRHIFTTSGLPIAL